MDRNYRSALQKGLEFAKSVHARVTAFFAIPEYPRAAYTYWETDDKHDPERYRLHWEDAAKKILGTVAKMARALRVPCELVHHSEFEPYEGIIRIARERDCDIIFMALHGRSGMRALLLGSVTQKVLTHPKIPVLVYH